MNLQENPKNLVVIVDDEPQVLRSLKWELEIAPFEQPLRIETFAGSDEALDFISQNSEDIFLLISDLRMPSPSLNGSDLLLHVHQEYPDIVLILLTAYSDLEEIQKAITAEIQALIFKPWTSGMLMSEIVKAQRLYSLRAENKLLQKRVEQQLEFAGEFQRQLLQPYTLESPNMKIDLRYEPLSDYKCGGDYYDYIKISDSKDLIIAGDVSGHGIKAAFVTAILKTLSMSIINEDRDISASDFLVRMNSRLCEILKSVNDIIVTFSVLLFNYDSGTLCYSNAGHMPVYRIRGKECEGFRLPGSALGYQEFLNFGVSNIDIEAGDRFVLFSDGLVESSAAGGLLEEETIIRELRRTADSDSPTDVIFNNFRTYHEQKNYEDDVLIAVVELKE